MPPPPFESASRKLERRIAEGDAGLFETVLARKSPDFYVVDTDLTVVFRHVQDGPAALPPEIAGAVRHVFATQDVVAAVVPVRRDLALRVLKLQGDGKAHYALFLEPYRGRDLVVSAVKRFALTSREGAVLDLVLRGAPTSEIAARLHITDGTVHQHIKNLGAKVGVTRRNAIVATVLGLAAA